MGHTMHCGNCGALACASICEKYGKLEYCEYFCDACYWQVRRSRRKPGPGDVSEEKEKKPKRRMREV